LGVYTWTSNPPSFVNALSATNIGNPTGQIAGSAGGISDVVADTTPQLGGNLDVNGQSIVSVSNGNIAITPDGSGRVSLDGVLWPAADGTNGQVLSTNGSGSASWATASGGTPMAVYRIESIQPVATARGRTFKDITSNWTEIYDTIGASTSSGQFTLPAGTYLTKWFFERKSSGGTGNVEFRLTNTSNATILTAETTNTNFSTIKYCVLTDYRTFASATTLKIRGAYTNSNYGTMFNLVLEFIKVA
jgi:hypothetical protein